MPKRKVRSIVDSKGTRYLNIGDLIPQDWKLVTAKKIKQNSQTVTIQIRKLLGEHDLAQNTTTNKTDK